MQRTTAASRLSISIAATITAVRAFSFATVAAGWPAANESAVVKPEVAAV